jgi:hypothetical protein
MKKISSQQIKKIQTEILLKAIEKIQPLKPDLISTNTACQIIKNMIKVLNEDSNSMVY